jgi:hypothetical protein
VLKPEIRGTNPPSTRIAATRREAPPKKIPAEAGLEEFWLARCAKGHRGVAQHHAGNRQLPVEGPDAAILTCPCSSDRI